MTTPLKHLLGIGLSALVLMGSVAPPALLHSHAGGHLPHEHHSNARHGEAITHVHGGHGAAPGFETAPARAAHAHLGLPGLDLSLPSVPGHSGEIDGEAGLVRLLGDFAPVVKSAVCWLNALAFASTASVAREGFAPRPVVASYPRARAAPLCDAARHECSGVLRT